jgi:hypothetical protein
MVFIIISATLFHPWEDKQQLYSPYQEGRHTRLWLGQQQLVCSSVPGQSVTKTYCGKVVGRYPE